MFQNKTFLVSEKPDSKLFCELTVSTQPDGYRIRFYVTRTFIPDNPETIELGEFVLDENEISNLRQALTPI